MMSVEELEAKIKDNTIDTVIVAFTDMQGRLVGKRLDAHFFLQDHIAEHGVEGCNYLLALDMEMNPVPGYRIASWEQGYGDFVIKPDLSTIVPIPWLEGTALILCDVYWNDGTPVAESPRQILKKQLERANALGFIPKFASELEFYLIKQTYAQAYQQHYHDLTPVVPYIIDYHILGTTYDEPFMHRLRVMLREAGIEVECSKGEASPGQYEVNLHYQDALRMADNHIVFKQAVKELAFQSGYSATFMAKLDHNLVGSSCHVHASLWQDQKNAFSTNRKVFESFLAGLLKYISEFAIFVAPNVNSYKRYVPGSWAPTALAWAYDNRTCSFRVVGKNSSFRIETRIPGADANPYLTEAAMLAAGLQGIEEQLELEPPYEGNAYESTKPRFPHTLRDAINLLEKSEVARKTLGDNVVEHYLNYARYEQQDYDRVVTCYERERFFERI
jgi:glutamine synthetase